ncbi:insulinase family protein [Halomonas pacifica]|uniref:insulinase family protein n=1 Tax=Bisbaumannia pacifica TaxID=77098 RepID=UPI00235864A2|nr:insulinase family protein [Halomonas pacifica]MDC8804926.1 insulinase family protein [Halomonas pacifica]
MTLSPPLVSRSLMLLATLWLAALVPGLARAEAPGEPSGSVETTRPHTSPQDIRDYRLLTLSNGLTALLVHDPEADKAAASMNVSVGSADDPEDLAGLAHFLEHMLFLGTAPFPDADAYQGYINRHGGSHNAFTAPHDTNYFFDIEPEALPGALDRFSQFFIAPLFNADRLESERNIVHSEYQARIRDEARREQDVLNQFLNPAHPGTGFSVGSRETLADPAEGEPSLRARVIDFYERHYDANVMHLALIAPQDLDTQETLVRERFDAIVDRDLEAPRVATPLVLDETLPLALATRSLRDRQQVSFLFPIPDPNRDYPFKPVDFLANLLGHEGEGSLLAALREAGLADALAAGLTRDDGESALFAVTVSLTPDGAERLDTIQASLFATIARLREAGPQAWRYEEQARLAEQRFRFIQHGEPIHGVTRLAMSLADYPAEDVLYAPYRMGEFAAERLTPYLQALTPERLIRLYSGPEVEGESTSPWFQAPYRAEARVDWPAAEPLGGLSLPEPNPFIAQDLSLLGAQDERPELRLETPGARLWHQAHGGFRTPQVEWRLSLQHPGASASPHQAVLSQLLAGWLNDSLNEAFYPARLAGQHFSAYAHARGLTLSFSGWRDRQARVMEEALAQLTEGEITAASLARVKQRLAREWRNAPLSALYQQANRTLGEALIRPQWPTADLLEALEPLDSEALRIYRRDFLAALHIEAMAIGDLDATLARQQALEVFEALAPRLPADAIADLTPLEAVDLPPLRPDSQRQESLLLRYLQGPDRTLASQAELAVLGQLLSTPFYTRLRTEEQLGYIVNAGYRPLLDAPGIALLVQSPETGSQAIGEHIDAFLETFDATLAELDDATLAPYRQAVRDQLLARDTSLGQLTDRLWRGLALGDEAFDRRERLAAEVMAVDAGRLRQAWQTLRREPPVDVAFDPGDEPSDVLALSRDLPPLPHHADE